MVALAGVQEAFLDKGTSGQGQWITESQRAASLTVTELLCTRVSCPHQGSSPWVWAGSVLNLALLSGNTPSETLSCHGRSPGTSPLTGEAPAGLPFNSLHSVQSSDHPCCTNFLWLLYPTWYFLSCWRSEVQHQAQIKVLAGPRSLQWL